MNCHLHKIGQSVLIRITIEWIRLVVKFIEIRKAVRIIIPGSILRSGIQPISDFPGIRHSIPIRIEQIQILGGGGRGINNPDAGNMLMVRCGGPIVRQSGSLKNSVIGRTDPTGNNRKGMSTGGKAKTGWNKSGKIGRIYGACPIRNLLEIGKSIPIRIRFQWIRKIGLEFIPIGNTISISI